MGDDGLVRVRANSHVVGLRRGDVADLPATDRVLALIGNGRLTRLDDDPSGTEAEQDDEPPPLTAGNLASATVDEVTAYVESGGWPLQSVLDMEAAGKDRATIADLA